ncbi:unnamed protein product [Closterium sp. NIES-65]|nr:unnamed protein product [Closterium sp. NIES-65]
MRLPARAALGIPNVFTSQHRRSRVHCTVTNGHAMASLTASLFPLSSLRVVEVTSPRECREIQVSQHTTWAPALTLQQFLQREQQLGSHAWAQANLRTWALVSAVSCHVLLDLISSRVRAREAVLAWLPVVAPMPTLTLTSRAPYAPHAFDPLSPDADESEDQVEARTPEHQALAHPPAPLHASATATASTSASTTGEHSAAFVSVPCGSSSGGGGREGRVERRRVLASLETYRQDALLLPALSASTSPTHSPLHAPTSSAASSAAAAPSDSVSSPASQALQGNAYGIASVFTPPAMRGQGLATHLCRAVPSLLAQCDPSALAAVLYSDVGEHLYARAGFTAPPHVLPPSMHAIGVRGGEEGERRVRESSARVEWLRRGEQVAAAVDGYVHMLSQRPAHSASFLVLPSAAQVDWMVEREHYCAQLLGVEPLPWSGARCNDALMVWTMDVAQHSKYIKVLLFHGQSLIPAPFPPSLLFHGQSLIPAPFPPSLLFHGQSLIPAPFPPSLLFHGQSLIPAPFPPSLLFHGQSLIPAPFPPSLLFHGQSLIPAPFPPSLLFYGQSLIPAPFPPSLLFHGQSLIPAPFPPSLLFHGQSLIPAPFPPSLLFHGQSLIPAPFPPSLLFHGQSLIPAPFPPSLLFHGQSLIPAPFPPSLLFYGQSVIPAPFPPSLLFHGQSLIPAPFPPSLLFHGQSLIPAPFPPSLLFHGQSLIPAPFPPSLLFHGQSLIPAPLPPSLLFHAHLLSSLHPPSSCLSPAPVHVSPSAGSNPSDTAAVMAAAVHAAMHARIPCTAPSTTSAPSASSGGVVAWGPEAITGSWPIQDRHLAEAGVTVHRGPRSSSIPMLAPLSPAVAAPMWSFIPQAIWV